MENLKIKEIKHFRLPKNLIRLILTFCDRDSIIILGYPLASILLEQSIERFIQYKAVKLVEIGKKKHCPVFAFRDRKNNVYVVFRAKNLYQFYSCKTNTIFKTLDIVPCKDIKFSRLSNSQKECIIAEYAEKYPNNSCRLNCEIFYWPSLEQTDEYIHIDDDKYLCKHSRFHEYETPLGEKGLIEISYKKITLLPYIDKTLAKIISFDKISGWCFFKYKMIVFSDGEAYAVNYEQKIKKLIMKNIPLFRFGFVWDVGIYIGFSNDGNKAIILNFIQGLISQVELPKKINFNNLANVFVQRTNGFPESIYLYYYQSKVLKFV